jgi:hypothetical protein
MKKELSRNSDKVVPDGLFVTKVFEKDSVVALELELHPKSHERYQKVLPSDIAFRVQRTVDALEKVPAERRRGIFESLIQFAEFSPTKLRLGVYTTEGSKAGAAKSSSRSSNNKGIVGSRTIKIGGESGIVSGSCPQPLAVLGADAQK